MVNYIFLLFRLMVHGHGNFATHLTRQLTKKKTRIIHPKSGSRDRLAAVTRIGTSLRSPSWWEVGSVSHPTPASSTIWSLEPALTGTWSKLRRTTLISVSSKWNNDDFFSSPFHRYSGVACKKVYFLWICRSHRYFEWFIDVLRDVERKDVTNVLEMHIFITQFFHKFDLRTTMLVSF